VATGLLQKLQKLSTIHFRRAVSSKYSSFHCSKAALARRVSSLLRPCVLLLSSTALEASRAFSQASSLARDKFMARKRSVHSLLFRFHLSLPFQRLLKYIKSIKPEFCIGLSHPGFRNKSDNETTAHPKPRRSVKIRLNDFLKFRQTGEVGQDWRVEGYFWRQL